MNGYSPRNPSDRPGAFVPGPGESILLGAMLGACHALAETTLLGWYGADLAVGDVAILLAVYPLLGSIAGGALWSTLSLAARIPGLGKGPGTGGARRGTFVTLSMIAYSGMGCWLIVAPRGGWAPAACVLVAVLAGGSVVHLGAREPPGSLRLALALFGAAVLVSGATILSTEAEAMTAGGRGLLAASLACLGLIPLAVAFRWGGSRLFTGARVGIAAIGAAIVVDLCLWASVLPVDIRWNESAREVAAPGAKDGLPDVLLIVLDTVRADHLDLFGYDRPTMPRLAGFGRKECAVALPITATSPSSLPSHGSIFTGMYPSSHGGHKAFVDDPDPPPGGYFVRDDVPTISGWLGGMGYRTVGISANHGVLSSFGLDRGFGEYHASPNRAYLAERLSWLGSFRVRGKAASRLLRHGMPRPAMRWTRWLNPSVPSYRRADEIVDAAIARLGARPDGPLFLFLNLMDAHAPYLPPGDLDERFAERPAGLDWTGHPAYLIEDLPGGAAGVRPDVLEYIEGQYDAEMVFIDRECDRLFRRLKEMGRYDETLIIVTGDHGESFIERGHFNHGRDLYEPLLSVPLLIKLPASSRATPPASVRSMQFVDLFPTILQIVGGETPPSVQGSAWGSGRDYAIAERFSRARGDEEDRRELFAVRIGDWKYIRSSTGEEECYDLALDPEERRNILGSRPELEERARRIFARRNAVMLRRTAGEKIDRATIERIRSLGYVK